MCLHCWPHSAFCKLKCLHRQEWSPEEGELPELPPPKEMGLTPAAHRAVRGFRQTVCSARHYARGAPLPDTIRHLLNKARLHFWSTYGLQLSSGSQDPLDRAAGCTREVGVCGAELKLDVPVGCQSHPQVLQGDHASWPVSIYLSKVSTPS